MHLYTPYPFQFAVSSIAANVYYESASPSTPIHLKNTDCSGDENAILECLYDSSPVCEHSEDVGIICSIPQSGNHVGVMYLVDRRCGVCVYSYLHNNTTLR